MRLPLLLLSIAVLAIQAKPPALRGFLRDPADSAERDLAWRLSKDPLHPLMNVPLRIPSSHHHPLVPAKPDVTDSSEVAPPNEMGQDEASALEFLKMFVAETEADMPHLFTSSLTATPIFTEAPSTSTTTMSPPSFKDHVQSCVLTETFVRFVQFINVLFKHQPLNVEKLLQDWHPDIGSEIEEQEKEKESKGDRTIGSKLNAFVIVNCGKPCSPKYSEFLLMAAYMFPVSSNLVIDSCCPMK